MTQQLFTPTTLGELQLANRIVMAPMTRNRAEADGTPNALMVEHYAQRADAGLIVAEGTWPEVAGQAYCRQPGIETPAQIQAWRRVTDAVHAREAGFDGVELHGTSGYLCMQFLSSSTNQRSDEYGGNASARALPLNAWPPWPTPLARAAWACA